MAAVMTYATLVADMILYAERSTDSVFIAQVPKLIAFAENKIAREIKGLGQQQSVGDTMIPNNPILQKPDRWRETISINYGTGTNSTTRNQLFARSLEFCRNYWPDPAVVAPAANLKYYADYDYSHWLLAGTPGSAYPYEVIYYERAVPLDATNQTNWNTAFAPDFLLAACMLECQPFLKNTERMAMWEAIYDRGAQGFDKENKRRTVDRATLVDKG